MIKTSIQIEVRYAETDQMGYVHHSQYALYLEQARMELLRSIGIRCEALEKQGVIMPVVSMEQRFSTPLRFGDRFNIECRISPPWFPRLEFRYRILNAGGLLVSRAKTTLVFADGKSGKLIPEPGPWLEHFNALIKEETPH